MAISSVFFFDLAHSGRAAAGRVLRDYSDWWTDGDCVPMSGFEARWRYRNVREDMIVYGNKFAGLPHSIGEMSKRPDFIE